MNFTILWIILITILALFLRILGIDKLGGLWNDEYISWFISSLPMFKSFVNGVLSQCHMPLYYLYLKLFLNISNNDTFLRLTSVLPALISVSVMYLVGREKSKLAGYLCAFFITVSSFSIYYSQEVRFYSLLFLFSAISLLFTIRLIKKQNKHNVFGYLISNILILFTHTIGFVYVFFSLVFVSIKLFKNCKKLLLTTWSILSISFMLALPEIIKIFATISFSQWWANFSINRLLQVFVDYFSPIISPIMLIENINGFNLFATPIVISTTIAVIILVIGIFYKKCRIENQVLYIAIATLFVLLLASLSGKLVLETKYSIEIFPILIFVFINTILSFSKKRIKIPVLVIFFAIQISYLFTINAPFWQPRPEGHKFATQLLEKANLKEGDYIVLTYYPKERFEKYFDFSKYNVIEIHKGNFNEYFMPKLSYNDAVKDGLKAYRGSFINDTKPLNEYEGNPALLAIDQNIYRKMNTNQKVVFLFLDSVSFLDETTFAKIVTDSKLYSKAPLLYLVFSDIRNTIIRTLPVKAKNIHYESNGSWTIVSFER